MKVLLLSATLLLLAACGGHKPGYDGIGTGPALVPPPSDGAAVVTARIDSLKGAARPGDLLFRLGDDIMSYSIRFLSEQDPSYSHVGLLLERDGRLQVAHIGPYEGGRDTLQVEPIDSFISPTRNLEAGLYRYRLSAAERDRFVAAAEAFGRQGVHFDYRYDLGTDDRLYCSELIAKALRTATQNRVHFPGKKIPVRMRKLMYAYLAKEYPDTMQVRERPYIALDQLYRDAPCDSILKISLRNNP